MTAPKQPPDSDEIKAIGGRPKWDKQSQYIFEVHAGIIAALNGGEKCADVFRSVVGAELHISVGQLLKKLEAGYERERIVLAELDRVTEERDELQERLDFAADGLAVIEKRRDELAAKVAAYELVVRECDTRMDCGFTCLICEETEQHSQDCPVPAALKALKE